MISLNNITVEFGGNCLFENITFLINRTDRIGLVGKNGAGKSTLLKVIAGLQAPSHGEVACAKDIKMGYLPQDMIHQNGRTVFEEAGTAFKDLLALENRLKELQHILETRTDYESKEYLNIVQQQTDIYLQLEWMNAANKEGAIEKILLGLGFERKDFGRQTSEFSGGWRMRIELAKILLQQPDILLLDEPTNHLDIESIVWFENFLKQYDGAVVIISHDKSFLDNVTNRTIEIVNQKIYDYRTNYSHYLELRKERIEQQEAAAKNQQKYIEKTEELINKYRAKANKAAFAQSLIKKLEKIERVEIDDWNTDAIKFRFSPPVPSGKIVLTVENVSKSYGEKTIFKNVDFILTRGEKVVFVGRNGEGKSTMMKIIAGQTDYQGKVTFGHNVMFGYFEQDQEEKLDLDKTVFDTIDELATGDMRKRVREILGSFLFSGDDVYKKVRVLSGGKRARLALCKLLLQPYNLLLLDEPTNHLDIQSKEILKQAIKNYEGTVIIVSHDRNFLSGLSDRIFEFKDKKVKEHLCSIDEFLEIKKSQYLKDTDAKIQSQKKENEISEKKHLHTHPDKEIKNIQSQIRKKEEMIEKTEKEIKAMETLLSDPNKYDELMNDAVFFDKYTQLKNRLETLMQEWEALIDKVNHFGS